jgi:hypothetical protein
MRANRLHCAVLLGLALAASGCPSLRYPAVQGDFEEAVRLDNVGSIQPFTRAEPSELYADVLATLTDDYIAGLDAKLRPNAWLLRAFAEWRTGKLDDAGNSAANGIRAGPADGTRDQLLLTLVPALVIDTQLRDQFVAAKRKVAPEDYDADFQAHFFTAFAIVAEVEALAGPQTPPGVVNYVTYQRWRLLQNWQTVVSSLPLEVQSGPAGRAERKLGGSLETALEKTKNSIPPGHPLRALIAAQEQQ